MSGATPLGPFELGLGTTIFSLTALTVTLQLPETMCRNIRTLYHFEPPVTDAEIHAASLQFVRKVSGFTKPSATNQAAFDQAVHDVSAVVTRLMGTLVTNAPPKNREVEAAKARARSAARFAKEREQKKPA